MQKQYISGIPITLLFVKTIKLQVRSNVLVYTAA